MWLLLYGFEARCLVVGAGNRDRELEEKLVTEWESRLYLYRYLSPLLRDEAMAAASAPETHDQIVRKFCDTEFPVQPN